MLVQATIEKILGEYDGTFATYEAFTRKVEHLVTELINNAGFSPHSVSSRVKQRASLHEKLRKEEADYRSLADVTDISGVRVTTYFHDDVDRIAELLVAEFEVDPKHSIDKRHALDPDRFGYLSLHSVVRLSQNRRALPEYVRFKELHCEIQIRSILQHAWAEIEHDLGYKSKVAVPKTVRRQFSRLAGLLELADQEFERIRRDLATYTKELPENIKERPAEVLLDKASLTEYLQTNGLVRELDEYIASKMQAKVGEEANLEFMLELLACVETKTIAQVDSALRDNADFLKKFAVSWLHSQNNPKYDAVARGVSLLYLSYVLLAVRGDRVFLLNVIQRLSIGRPDEQASMVEEILNVYQSAKSKS
jgi:putative GTP pyrophosphokinase